VACLVSGRQKRNCSVWSAVSRYRTNTMNCASFPKSVVSPNSEIRFRLRFAAAIICFRISTESSGMRNLMVLFDNGTTANLLAAASLHIILAIFTGAGLTKLSPTAKGAFALAFFQATEKVARTALLCE